MSGEKPKSAMDSFLDMGEALVGGMENVFKTHEWRAEEILDGTGKEPSYWEVSNGQLKFKASNEADAKWLVERLA